MSKEQHEIWEFPCDVTFKAMAVAIEGIENNIISAIQKHVPGDYTATIKQSGGGKYISVSVHLYLTNKSQLHKLYQEVYAVEGVKMVL